MLIQQAKEIEKGFKWMHTDQILQVNTYGELFAK